MPPDDTAAPSPPITVLIPAAIRRRMAGRIAPLRGETGAFVATLPAAREPRP